MAASNELELAAVLADAADDGLAVDLAVERHDGVYVVRAHLLLGDAVVGEHVVKLGRLKELGRAGPAVLLVWAGGLAARVVRMQARVSRAMAVGRT
jgi:hypothetical protein